MNLEELKDLYLATMEHLLSAKANIFVNTNQGAFMNFRSRDFRKAVYFALEKQGYEPNRNHYAMFMQTLRTMDWIICEDNRFTTTQKINGKTIRVITVCRKKYELLNKNNEVVCFRRRKD